MGFERPKILVHDTLRRTVRYLFNDPETGPNPMDGEYYLRGGVCWPVIMRQGAELTAGGFVLIVGQHLLTGKRYVFDELAFTCVDPVVNAVNGKVEFAGAAGWFSLAWATWGCRDYYRNQTDLTHRTYLMQTIRSKMIEPKPQFIEVEWKKEEQVTPILWKLNSMDQLRYQHQDKGGQLHGQLRDYEREFGHVTIEDYPAVYALVCALCGMERAPWRAMRN